MVFEEEDECRDEGDGFPCCSPSWKASLRPLVVVKDGNDLPCERTAKAEAAVSAHAPTIIPVLIFMLD